MSNKKITTTLTISGMGEFPLDMLRYDACWPLCSDDAELIGLSQIREFRAEAKKSGKPFIITVCGVIKGFGTGLDSRWTLDRWISFGYRVVRTGD